MPNLVTLHVTLIKLLALRFQMIYLRQSLMMLKSTYNFKILPSTIVNFDSKVVLT